MWLLAPIGFPIIAALTRRFFVGAEGSGIPQTIFALRPDAGALGDQFMRVRVVAGRVGLAALSLLCGGSIGREGPTVHVGAALVQYVSRWLPHGRIEAQRRMLLLAGGAAGVAAAFNTPLAGIVFAIEELSRSFEERASGVVLTAVVLAGVVAIALMGDYTYFGQPLVARSFRPLSLAVFAVAVVGGVCGGLMSRLTLALSARPPHRVGRWREQHAVLFAAVCGLLVALIAALAGNLTLGTGYEEARGILESGTSLPWYYAPARAAATLLSYLSGIPAGLLAPSLSVGAGIGQTLADVMGADVVPLAILGMCSYLAGVTQAPLTSLVIVMEMTSQHGMVLPLMVAAALATPISRLFSPPLYQTLADRYR